MKLPTFFGILFLTIAQPLFAASPLTLEEALVTALKNHPQVVEAKENLKGAEARTGQALANYYPQISFSADWNKGRTFLSAQENIKLTEVHSDAFYLKQTIYDFGRTSGSIEAARSNRDAIDKALIVTTQDLSLRVRSAFYLVLATEKQNLAVRDTVRSRDDIFRQAEEFFKQGIKAKVDVARAESNLFAAKTALIRTENNRESAKMELANAMGMSALEDRTLVEPPPSVVSLPEKNSALQEAVRNRVELKQVADQKAVASANLKIAKGSYLPILSGMANVGYADKKFPPNGNIWGVGLDLTVPLFSGFSSVEQVREATSTINAIEARQSNLRLQIIKEVESAWLGGNEASARMVSTQKEVVAANENKLLAEGRYQEGVGSIIEVTDAQSQALDAQTANIQAKYDYYTSLARLDRAIGRQ